MRFFLIVANHLLIKAVVFDIIHRGQIFGYIFHRRNLTRNFFLGIIGYTVLVYTSVGRFVSALDIGNQSCGIVYSISSYSGVDLDWLCIRVCKFLVVKIKSSFILAALIRVEDILAILADINKPADEFVLTNQLSPTYVY